jgi:hypothetical protein
MVGNFQTQHALTTQLIEVTGEKNCQRHDLLQGRHIRCGQGRRQTRDQLGHVPRQAC